MPAVPLGAGTVSLGLHPTSSAPREAITGLLREALLAETVGFDGVTVSEHHAGAAGYFANPVLVASALLSTLRTAWVGACPVVLPLHSAVGVLEDVAFLAAAFPGRVALGVAPGWADEDFVLYGVDGADRRRLFEEGLGLLTAVRDDVRTPSTALLRRDPLVAMLAGDFPTVVSAAGSGTAARRAARAGVGMILSQFMAQDQLGRLTESYRDAGGPGPVILIRRFWMGDVIPDGLVRMMSELGAWVDRGVSQLAKGDAAQVLDRLAATVEAVGADALNLRVQFPGMTRDEYESQITQFGTEVLADLLKSMRGTEPNGSGRNVG